ncbi:C-type lectin-like domain-containing protein [Faecalibacter bovis]|uniref:C-type lectin domain-containing protein n=1 Tax=Faecalibacter bovis TaxID=2898187 RepID=A0ABX7XEL4_9FLAO|nr:lectin-like protein [Faecalibacter bovis]MBS7332474.1 hypothetical protein [Weeksellaceae bacterium]QTV06227.1 hypothetical protein J9309_02530 [Faecalibacter bovis]
MKHNLLLGLLLLNINSLAQVSISYDPLYEGDKQSVLDLSDVKNKGFLGPKVALNGIYDNLTIIRPSRGLVVYNTNTVEVFDPNTSNMVKSIVPGYYSWDGSKWLSFESKETTNIVDKRDFSITSLGYLPSGAFRNAPLRFEKDDIIAIQTKCVTNTNQTGQYCSFDLQDAAGNIKGVDWNSAYQLAKEIGGHLPVITTNSEIEFLYKNYFHKDIQSNSRYFNSWIGLKSVALPGEKEQFKWITGEYSDVNWLNGKLEYEFENGSPSQLGCVHYSEDLYNINLEPNSTGQDIQRKWEVSPCDVKERYNNQVNQNFPMSYLIVEFLFY